MTLEVYRAGMGHVCPECGSRIVEGPYEEVAFEWFCLSCGFHF